MSIRVRFTIIIGSLSLVACIILASASYQFSMKNAMTEAKTQGAMVFSMIDSVRLNFKKNQYPTIMELVDENRFFPEIMSGFVVARGVWEKFADRFPGYTFKQATIDPLYPPNKADADELEFIRVFDNDKTLKNSEGTIEKDGKQYYYFARPISVGSKCLRCHGEPDNAPKDQLEIYGEDNGYNWKAGQVVSTSIVYVPLDAATAAAKKSAIYLFSMGSVGILFLMGVLWFFLSSGVVAPLITLRDKTQQISLGRELEEEVGIHSEDEIGELAQAIDRLRISTDKMLKRIKKSK
jgi:HAMP domain-containing protein